MQITELLAYEVLHGLPTERADLAAAINAQLHANMNRAKGADPVSAHAFMPLADGPLAPPRKKPKPSRKAIDAAGAGLKAFLGARMKGRR